MERAWPFECFLAARSGPIPPDVGRCLYKNQSCFSQYAHHRTLLVQRFIYVQLLVSPVLSVCQIQQQYSRHFGELYGDPTTNIQNNVEALQNYGLPTKPVIINEYAVKPEQVPGLALWYISQLERFDTNGLRGNWASGYSLRDYFTNLLGKPGATETCSTTDCATFKGYWGYGAYDIYKYYNLNMNGTRVETFRSPDARFDVYATRNKLSTSSVRILCGSRLAAGTWDILVTGSDAMGLLPQGTIRIPSYQFNYSNGEFGGVAVTIDHMTYAHTYSINQLVFYVSPESSHYYGVCI